MRIFFDTEFIEDGKTIELLSIGMVREDGETLYLESSEADRSLASDWVKENVLPHLNGIPMKRWRIANRIINFVGHNPEFWAYYADYDWVALCQLYGTMMDLPDGWPMFCMDLKQAAAERGNPDLHALVAQDGPEHNALADAQWVADVWRALVAPDVAHIDDLTRQLEDARRLALPAFTSPEGDLSEHTHVLERCEHGRHLIDPCIGCDLLRAKGRMEAADESRPSAYDMPVGSYVFGNDYDGGLETWVRVNSKPGGWDNSKRVGIQSGWIEGLFTDGLVTEWRLP